MTDDNQKQEARRLLEMDVHQLQDLLSKNEVLLIDVREPWEYNVTHIEGAQNIPLGLLQSNNHDIDAAEIGGRKIVAQCKSGFRSLSGSALLISYFPEHEVYNLTGGITEWVKNGYPIIQG